MNDHNSSKTYSLRFYFSIAWVSIAILVAIYFAVSHNNYAPLFIIVSLAPLLLLIMQKFELLSQRTLRDSSELKEKAFKLFNSWENSHTEIKALRARTRVISARNNLVLETVKKLNQTVEDSLPEIHSSPIQEDNKGNLDPHALESANTDLSLKMRNESEDFLDHFSRLLHFASIPHPNLTTVQQTEISKILESFRVSTVLLVDMDPLWVFNRPLSQSVITDTDDFQNCIPETSKPFVVIMRFETLKSLSDPVKERLRYLDAAYIVPEPLTTEEISAYGFSRLPTDAEFNTVELICPAGFINSIEMESHDNESGNNFDS